MYSVQCTVYSVQCPLTSRACGGTSQGRPEDCSESWQQHRLWTNQPFPAPAPTSSFCSCSFPCTLFCSCPLLLLPATHDDMLLLMSLAPLLLTVVISRMSLKRKRQRSFLGADFLTNTSVEPPGKSQISRKVTNIQESHKYPGKSQIFAAKVENLGVFWEFENL